MGLFKKTKETETRMNREEMLGAIRKIQGWKIVADFSVGGLEWIAFSKRCPSMLVVISSQKSTTVESSFYNGVMTCDGSEIFDAKHVSQVK